MALRERVVQRKIMGALRNGKGAFVRETITTFPATWKQHYWLRPCYYTLQLKASPFRAERRSEADHTEQNFNTKTKTSPVTNVAFF
jgi:hypothetical protein